MSNTLLGSIMGSKTDENDESNNTNSKNNNTAPEEPKGSDWVGFAKSIVSALILVFVWALIGSNFMYLQNYVAKNETYYGNLFPTESRKPPYSDTSSIESLRSDIGAAARKGLEAMKGKLSRVRKGGLDKLEKQPLLKRVPTQFGGAPNSERYATFQKVAGLDKFSFPYTWKKSEPGLWGDFKAWLANSVEFSYIFGRDMMNKMFDLTYGLEGSVGAWLIILLSVPLVAILLQIVPIYGFLSTLFGEFQAPNKGWLWALVFLFILGFDFLIAGAVGIVQTLQLFFTMLVLPLFLDHKGVFEIMSEHSIFYTGMFGFMVVANSFSYLETAPSIMMFLTYLGLLWYNRPKDSGSSPATSK